MGDRSLLYMFTWVLSIQSWEATTTIMHIEFALHPKLHNINLHNITHSLISRNPREWMCVVQISLLIITSPLYHWFFHWCKPSKKSTHTLALHHVECHLLLLLLLLTLLPLVEYWCMPLPHCPGKSSGVDHTNGGERENESMYGEYRGLVTS